MNRVRNIVNSNKGLITFWLLVIFLTAGLSKSLVSVLHTVAKKEAVTHAAFKHVVTTDNAATSSLSFLDQFKDTDSDDLEFAFFGNSVNPQFLPVVVKQQKFTEFASYSSIYTGQLYDLYCNWKFHLS